MNILYFICAMCNIRKYQASREREREKDRREIEARRGNLNERTKRRSDGEKTSNHYFNFCVLSQQQHTFIARQELTHCIPPNKNLSLFRPLSFSAPFAEGKTPDPGFDRLIFMAYTATTFMKRERKTSFFSFDRIFLC
jgi:hypothetical protein